MRDLIFFLIDKKAISFFIRSFPAFLVLILLIFQQFLFSDFIDAELSITVYGLCFFILFIESLFLFFYKENKKINFEVLLLFFSAVFLISLPFFIQELSFFFLSVFLSCILILSLLFLNKIYSAFIFLLYTICLLPFGSFSLQALSFKEQKSFTLFSCLFLGMVFLFSFLLRLFLNIEAKALKDQEPSDFNQDLDPLLSLNFARKLKPFLNSFLKYFSKESEDSKEVAARLFSSQNAGAGFKKFKKYITDFIEYMELNRKSFSLSNLDLKKLLKESCEELQKHPKKPQNLKIQINISDSFFVKASAKHLKKGFQHIIINAFEALNNEEQPKLSLSVFKQKYWALIEFLDNGHGIEEEDLIKIFDPFFSKREFGKGFRGFGLAYVQKMIQAHLGEVKAKRLEKGTLITIKLPLIQYEKTDYLKSVKKDKKPAA